MLHFSAFDVIMKKVYYNGSKSAVIRVDIFSISQSNARMHMCM